MGQLHAGDRAPDFTLETVDGPLTLNDLRGQPVILYFYPKDDTPGCTKEACDFQGSQAKLKRSGAVVLGVSGDSTASHQKFAAKFELTFPLLSDPECTVSKAYGVYKEKSMYGRTFWGIERTTFVIDAQGTIAQIFPKVKVDGHIDEVLGALKALRQAA